MAPRPIAAAFLQVAHAAAPAIAQWAARPRRPPPSGAASCRPRRVAGASAPRPLSTRFSRGGRALPRHPDQRQPRRRRRGAPEDVPPPPPTDSATGRPPDLLARRGGADGAIGVASPDAPPAGVRRVGGAQRGASSPARNESVDGGLVAGLEMLVSHVRRARRSGAAGADALDAPGGGLNGAIGSVGGYEAAIAAAEQRAAALRSRTSPLAGRRALPPSAQTAGGHHATASRASTQSASSAAAEEAALAAAAAGGHAASALSTSDVDDAIFSFAASLRANRRAYGNGTADGADDDGVLGWANGNSTLGLSATLPPSGAPLHSSFGGGPPPVQPLSAASRQRWSARDKERHGIGPFSTKDAHGAAPAPGMPPAAACGHGLGGAASNWPPAHGNPPRRSVAVASTRGRALSRRRPAVGARRTRRTSPTVVLPAAAATRRLPPAPDAAAQRALLLRVKAACGGRRFGGFGRRYSCI